MTFSSFPSLSLMVRVERQIGRFLGPHAFVGGACVGFYIRDMAGPEIRPTDDVDVTVEVATRAAYYELEATLRRAGMENDLAVLCRWHFEGVTVDIVPTDDTILSFSNPWYPEVLRSCETASVDGVELRYPNVWAFLATKVEAFVGRGCGDYVASRDFEDIVRVIDGDAELVESRQHVSPDACAFVSRAVGEWLGLGGFHDDLAAHLLDEGSGERYALVLNRFSGLAV